MVPACLAVVCGACLVVVCCRCQLSVLDPVAKLFTPGRSFADYVPIANGGPKGAIRREVRGHDAACQPASQRARPPCSLRVGRPPPACLPVGVQVHVAEYDGEPCLVKVFAGLDGPPLQAFLRDLALRFKLQVLLPPALRRRRRTGPRRRACCCSSPQTLPPLGHSCV